MQGRQSPQLDHTAVKQVVVHVLDYSFKYCYNKLSNQENISTIFIAPTPPPPFIRYNPTTTSTTLPFY